MRTSQLMVCCVFSTQTGEIDDELSVLHCEIGAVKVVEVEVDHGSDPEEAGTGSSGRVTGARRALPDVHLITPYLPTATHYSRPTPRTRCR